MIYDTDWVSEKWPNVETSYRVRSVIYDSKSDLQHMRLKRNFNHGELYFYTVSTYIGGLFSALFCSDNVNPLDISYKELNRKFSQTSIETLYYNPGIHLGAFHVPGFMKERLL